MYSLKRKTKQKSYPQIYPQVAFKTKEKIDGDK